VERPRRWRFGGENIEDVAVCCGFDEDTGTGEWGSSYALESSGYVWAWGDGYLGKLGQGPSDLEDYDTPVKVKDQSGQDFLSNIVAISAGSDHVLALDKDGYVWGWGDNLYGQLGVGDSYYYCTKPVKVKKDASNFLDNIVYIDAGFEHSTAIDKYGNFWVWGSNEFGQLAWEKERRMLSITQCKFHSFMKKIEAKTGYTVYPLQIGASIT